jgi:uncharacterized SAM-binding protein YcdF (DUF218 family)
MNSVLDRTASPDLIARGRRRWLRPLVVTAVLVLVIVTSLVWALAELGTWLVVADPLEAAPAVVVLSGSMPYRAMEAARIYRDGWARQVWLTQWEQENLHADLASLGILIPREYEYSREVLVRSGVPGAAIRLLEGRVLNTVDEVQIVARELGRMDGKRVILVTSPPHTRRVRAIWRAIVGDSPAVVVRPTTAGQYDGARWWRSTSDALAVSREVFGLMNVWAGFPVKPRQ